MHFNPCRAAALKRATAVVLMATLLAACGGKDDDQVLTAQQLADLPAGQGIKLKLETSASGGVSVAELVKVSETRVSRTHFDYTFRLRVVNGDSAPWTGVEMRLAATGPGTAVVDGTSVVGFLPIGGEATPADTITLRHDRTKVFELARLLWAAAGDRVNQTAIGPEQTGVAGKIGVAISRAGATVMAVDGSASAPPVISIHPMVRTDVKPEFLVGGTLFEFVGVSANALALFESPSAVEAVYECELDKSQCMVVPSVGQVAPGRLVFPIQAAKMYAVEVK